MLSESVFPIVWACEKVTKGDRLTPGNLQPSSVGLGCTRRPQIPFYDRLASQVNGEAGFTETSCVTNYTTAAISTAVAREVVQWNISEKSHLDTEIWESTGLCVS